MKNKEVNKALRARIVEFYGNQCAFAEAVGCTQATVSRVLRGQHLPKKQKAKAWCEALGLAPEEAEYFFTKKDLKSSIYPIPTESDTT